MHSPYNSLQITQTEANVTVTPLCLTLLQNAIVISNYNSLNFIRINPRITREKIDIHLDTHIILPIAAFDNIGKIHRKNVIF